jgi:hypothetical protein
VSAWLGISIGVFAGGIAGYAASKLLKQKPDVGIIGAAAAAGGLIGGALTATSAAAEDTMSTLLTVDLSKGAQTLAVKIGDVVDFTPPSGARVTAIRTNGSDVVFVASVDPATVNIVKPGGALLTLLLSTGEGIEVKLTTM